MVRTRWADGLQAIDKELSISLVALQTGAQLFRPAGAAAAEAADGKQAGVVARLAEVP